MDIHITTRKVSSGVLATVRVRTAEDILWYRVTLPEVRPLAAIQHELVQQTLAHLRRHGGPAAKLVLFQLALPMGGGE